ncbi:MAG: hypothetical protein ACP5G1_00365 [Nanopusillaceae archaeon]
MVLDSIKNIFKRKKDEDDNLPPDFMQYGGPGPSPYDIHPPGNFPGNFNMNYPSPPTYPQQYQYYPPDQPPMMNPQAFLPNYPPQFNQPYDPTSIQVIASKLDLIANKLDNIIVLLNNLLQYFNYMYRR